MNKKNSMCQSCGMPLKRDENGGGTNFDGTKSLLFCSHCFRNGSFTQPNLTAKDMQNQVVEHLVKMKFPKFIAKFPTHNIPNLQRWKTEKPN